MKMKERAQTGFAHVLLVIGLVALLAVALGVFVVSYQKPAAISSRVGVDKVSGKIGPSTRPTLLPTKTKGTENPFEKTSQYSNPFEGDKNPLDYLNE